MNLYQPAIQKTSKLKNLIQKKSTKIISILVLLSLVGSLYLPNQAKGTDFTPSSESYQATPTTLDNTLSNYQTTSLTAGNYTSVGADDANYMTTTGSNTLPQGEQLYGTSGTYSWTAPAGVTNISVVCVGGGGSGYGNYGIGGGGGGLGYKNNISVTPGNSYAVVVGRGAANITNGSESPWSGEASYFINASTVSGGGGGWGNTGAGGNYTGDGGGNGGSGSHYGGNELDNGGGGGAGGYTGNGGQGSDVGAAGSGGGGGGGNNTSKGGGGVGVYGLGDNGASNGGGGSGGGNSTTRGGAYGGGGAAKGTYGSGTWGYAGGGGACRIIWGSNRSFPNTNAGYLSTQSGSSTYATQLYTFSPTSFTNYSRIDVSLIAYATASAGNGINAKIWNKNTSSWDALSSLTNTNSSMPSSLSTQSLTSNVNNYVDASNKIKILVHSTNPSVSGTNAVLNTDFIKVSVYGAPAVSTNATTSITPTTATGNGNLTSANGDNVTRYMEWGTTSGSYTNSCNAGSTTSSGTYSCNLINLNPNTTYYYRAKATGVVSGTSYGTELSFTTSIGAPDIETNQTTSVTNTSATGHGNITNTNGEDPERFVEWGTTSGSYTNSCTAGIGSTGAYSCNLTNLQPNTTYYTRAKATNSAGTSYGQETTFSTLPDSVTINNPDPTKLQNANTNNYFSIEDGTLNNTSKATTNTDLTFTTSLGQATLPTNTEITNTEGGNINMEEFSITNQTNNTRSTQHTTRGSIEIGIPNTRLSFSNPITLNIEIDPIYNGETLNIFSKEANSNTWNDENKTCTVTNGICSFTTTHATTYTVNGDGTLKGDTDITNSLDIAATISIDCTNSITMNPITGTGTSLLDASNEATCNVKTNNSQGYKLEWSTNQENLTNANNDTISPYLPTTPNTPEIWSINQSNSAWGARLKSTSTDKDNALWGATDDYTGKWLNIDTTSYQIIQRNTETAQTGSDQIIQFGAEIGSNKFQPTGTYSTSVVMTATTL